MSDDGKMPRAASAARDAAQRARELAEFLEEYAETLDAPDHEVEVGELAEIITRRLHALRKVVRLARESRA